ncbi:MAG: SpoIID/LytB domain-containing protein [Butyrivibrio sp.]
MKKPAVRIAAYIFACLVFPFIITVIMSGKENGKGSAGKTAWLAVNDDKSADKNTDVNDYVTGTVAAYYRDGDSPEFLKVMAVIARTYAAYVKGDGTMMDSGKLSMTTLTAGEMRSIWGASYESNYAVVSQAVKDTENIIITCDGKPVLPYFHSLSAGWTREGDGKYLNKVACIDDTNEPDYVTIVDFQTQNLKKILQKSIADVSFDDSVENSFQIISRDSSGYVEEVMVGSRTVTGSQLCEILGLSSAAFSINVSDDLVVFTVKGNGSGYGVSLSMARKKAQEGATYKEILDFFYKDIKIESE